MNVNEFPLLQSPIILQEICLLLGKIRNAIEKKSRVEWFWPQKLEKAYYAKIMINLAELYDFGGGFSVKNSICVVIEMQICVF